MGEVRRTWCEYEFKEASWIYVYNCGNCYLLFFDPKYRGHQRFMRACNPLSGITRSDTARITKIGPQSGFL